MLFLRKRKKMKKQIVILGIIFLIIFTGLSGCIGNESNSEKDKFLGTWYQGSVSSKLLLIFYSNGDCNFLGDQATWEIKNKNLIVNFTNIQNELIFDYVFLDDGNILELTEVASGIISDYRKQ
jgi:hypothetical protein